MTLSNLSIIGFIFFGDLARKRFSSQASPEVLAALRQIATSQGRPFHVVLEDDLRDYIEREQAQRPRMHVISDLASSMDEYDHTYQKLAK